LVVSILATTVLEHLLHGPEAPKTGYWLLAPTGWCCGLTLAYQHVGARHLYALP
jgi:hypothetical protein